MNLLSICIPTYEMSGQGHIFLEKSFKILIAQTFKDFNVIISDHSKDNLIEKLCQEYQNQLQISYYRNENERGSISANINYAIEKANGTLIKILFQDDFLFDENSLEEIREQFDLQKDNWLITACIHTKDGINFFRPFYPRYNKMIFLGKNTISSPSVLTIKNKNHLIFDKKLIWLMDCDYYYRCYNKFGNPKILNKINVVNRIGEHQVTHININIFIRIREILYIMFK
ncbi:MAG: glycosyltransferase [Candidatus Paceibacterota bacterium]